MDEKQCGSLSAGFIRSQLIWIFTVFKRKYKFKKMYGFSFEPVKLFIFNQQPFIMDKGRFQHNKIVNILSDYSEWKNTDLKK